MNATRPGAYPPDKPQDAQDTAARDDGHADAPLTPPGDSEWDMDPEIYLYMDDDEDSDMDWADDLPPEDLQPAAPPPQPQPQSHPEPAAPEYHPAQAPYEPHPHVEQQPQPQAAPLEPYYPQQYAAPSPAPVIEHDHPPLADDLPEAAIQRPPKKARTKAKKITPRRALPKFSISPKRLAVPGAVIALTALGIFTLAKAPGMAQARLEQTLHRAGFPDAKIGDLSLSLTQITASKITLDKSGYDQIKTIEAAASFPAFLFTGNISGLKIDGVRISRTQDASAPALQKLALTLANLPDYRVTISNARLDLGTAYGELSIMGDAQINTDENSGRDIKARIRTDQYQLGFDSVWQGVMNADGMLDMTGDITEGRMNAGPLRISRFTGWSALTLSKDGYTLQSQMDAGSAAFMGLPLQNLSMAQEMGAANKSAVLRAGISGLPDMHFSLDYLANKDKNILSAVLSGNNLANFLDFIEVQTGRKKELVSPLIDAGAFEMRGDYQPDRRFAGGPLPFEITLTADGKKSLGGNILFYPATMEARGSLETDTGMAAALKNYFKIPSANMSKNSIRVDGSVKSLLGAQEE